MSLDTWKKLTHANVVQLRDVFNTRVFGDDSVVFVYDFHATAETVRAKHFMKPPAAVQYRELAFLTIPLGYCRSVVGRRSAADDRDAHLVVRGAVG